MVIFPILVMASLVLYIYNKVAILRTADEVSQHYYQSKARMSLGVFMIAFAVSQYMYYQSKLSLLIGLLFIVIGFLQLFDGRKESKHYRNEWQRLNP